MSRGQIKPLRVKYAASSGICPRCRGVVKRVQRRRFDRFINIFLPVYRYRCCSLVCSWQGNLLVRWKLRRNNDASDDTTHNDR